MNFTEHSDLIGTHAFLSPSQNAWTNYTEEKLIQRYLSSKAVERGTRLHEFAAEAIELNRKQSGRDTLSMYVNLVSDWYNCPICNGPTMPIFMVHDDLWKSVAKEHARRAICWSCFEKLLGRRITVNDLKPDPPCNWDLIEQLKKGQVITTKGI